MNVDLREVLRAISPVALQARLRNRGWELNEVQSTKARAVYERDGQALDVPLHTEYGDYVRRLEEVVGPLARLENVPLMTLIDELTQPEGDVLALRMHSDSTAKGTVPLEGAIRMREAAKTLILASAHSAMRPQAWFSRMARTEPVALLAAVQEAQTQRGSFTARFIVPVEPEIGQQTFDEPLGRRAMTVLVRALDAVHRVRSLGAYDELLTMEKQGVSGNLLSALSSLSPPGGAGMLEVSVAWSQNRRPPEGVVSSVRFSGESLVGLNAVAEAMRGQAKARDFEVVGYVTRLARHERDTGPGEVVIVPTEGEAREVARTVVVELDAAAYEAAIEAHRVGATVQVSGTLQRVGRRWQLSDASDFQVLEVDTD